VERKRQELLAHEAGASAAKAMKAQLDTRLAELRTLLTSVLDTPPLLSFAMLKHSVAVPRLSNQAISANRCQFRWGRTSRRHRPASCLGWRAWPPIGRARPAPGL
jgi:hypothetical protein